MQRDIKIIIEELIFYGLSLVLWQYDALNYWKLWKFVNKSLPLGARSEN